MEVILPREVDIDRQLLPGSIQRDINLVESVAELRAQMEASNSAAIRVKRKIMVVSAILAVGTLFYSFKSETSTEKKANFAKYLKYIGSALAVLSLVKAASSKENKLKVVPHSSEFSAKDKAYSYFKSVNETSESTPFMKLVIKSILDLMVATKLVKPYDISNKQKELMTNSGDMNKSIKNAIITY